MKNRTTITTLLLICLAFVFTTCKKVKYPENDKKTRQPQKYETNIMRGFITSYKVNGIDSFPLFTTERENYFKGEFDIQVPGGRHRTRSRNYFYGGVLEFDWSDDYKSIYIRTDLLQIFKTSGAKWEILKYEVLKGTTHYPFKIRSTINNNVYEIQFN
ncbi:MAG: hypothetical protein KF900_02510 [Bacteroidetes bacterium]|nr:hypothetical protein [Bacteroidota bacterium]